MSIRGAPDHRAAHNASERVAGCDLGATRTRAGGREIGWTPPHEVWGTGLREHEILALNVGDVFDENGRARRRLALRVFKRASQEPAPQEVFLPDLVRSKLEKLLAGRRRAGESLTPETPLFVSRLGRRLSTRQLRHAFGVWQKRAGFERHFSFHSLRHSSCANVYRASKDLRLTQRFARHKSVITTTIYTHPSDEELLRSVQSLIC